jgi:para-nitrobenzyl esterase
MSDCATVTPTVPAASRPRAARPGWWWARCMLFAAPLGLAATPPAPPASVGSAPLARVAVTVPQGTLLGTREDGLQVFRGIPFAAAPVGEWRWRPPRPAPAWRGVRDAGAFGPVCPQPLRAGYSEEDLGGRPMSEDCLHLNVWSPEPAASRKHPVMLWLLPGGFTRGDSGMSRYDGSALARRGVVVVSFNYRLGLFGEFAHPAMSRAQAGEPLGNYQLMDQLAALRWVRANIAAFGGDPGNVTIFGMSAGGMSVNYLMASPAAAGLFDKAISQSSALRMSHDRKLAEDARGIPSLEAEGASHAKKLGLGADDAAALTGLRALTMQQLLDYQASNPIGAAGGLNPVIDGRLLVEPVGATFLAHRQHKVPYLTGATNWEASLVKGGARSLPPVLGILNVTRGQADSVYREPNEEWLGWKIYTDFFLATQRYLAKAHAATGQPTYVYRFSRVLDEHQGDYFGAAHGAETRYVFGTLDALSRVAGPDRAGDFGWRVNDADRAYSDLVASYWVQFARTGNPNRDGLPGWPAVTPGNDLLLEFGQQAPQVRRDFMPERWRFFEAHFADGKL